MATRTGAMSPDSTRKDSGSAPNSPTQDGLDKVELSDLDSTPPQLPVEQDLMQLARLGELRAIQKLFDSGRYTARSTDDQGITPLHVRAYGTCAYEGGEADIAYSGLQSTDIMHCVTFSFSQAPMSTLRAETLWPHQCFGRASASISRSYPCSCQMVPTP